MLSDIARGATIVAACEFSIRQVNGRVGVAAPVHPAAQECS